VRTLGVDLASDPAKTGVCIIRWDDDSALVEELAVGADDDSLIRWHERAEVTGVDAPFGWPVPFVQMVDGDSRILDQGWTPERRDELRFRITDHRVCMLTGSWPLSVSSDLIAVPAMRCIALLHRLGVKDKSGDGRVYETYPAAALRVWGLRATGYKGAAKRSIREELVAELMRRAQWLAVAKTPHLQLMIDRDDAFDALVAALIARAATLGLTHGPGDDDRPQAAIEGWIHVPVEGSLERLF
jgi:predicted nuclease with RNAse H fold